MRLEGRLEDFNLLDVVQAALRYPSRSRLLVADDEHEGMLQLDGGMISMARWNQLSGEEAVFQLLTHERGFFSLDGVNDGEAEGSLGLSWPGLLQRAFQRAVNGQADSEVEPPPLNADQRQALIRDLEILFQSLDADAERFSLQNEAVGLLLLQCEMLNMTVSLAPEQTTSPALKLTEILARRGWRGSGASFVQLNGPLIDSQTLNRLYQAAAFDAVNRSREAQRTAEILAAALDDLLSALIDLVKPPGHPHPLQDRTRALTRTMIASIDSYNF